MNQRLTPKKSTPSGRTFPVALRMQAQIFQRIYALALENGYSTERQILIALEEWLAAREKQTGQL